MIQVSQLVENKLLSDSRMTRIHGTVDSHAFTSDDFLVGSLSITKQSSDSSDFKIGGVFVGEMKVSFLKQSSVYATMSGEWLGAEIVLYFDVKTGTDTWESIPLGTYYVAQADRTPDGMSLKCYDGMSRLGKSISGITFEGSYWKILSKIADKCDVTLGQTRAQIESFFNTDLAYSLYPENDCSTYRDVLYWLTQIVGGFAYFNYENKLIIRDYGFSDYGSAGQPDFEIDSFHRTKDTKIADYNNNFQELLLTHTDDGLEYFHQTFSLESGRIYHLGENPFLQFEYGYQNYACGNIVSALRLYKFFPSETVIPCDPRIELGDRYRIAGGMAYNEMSCVQYINLKFGKSMTIKCFGKNPTIGDSTSGPSGGAKTSTGDQVRSKTMTYFSNYNSSAITIERGDDPKRVAYTSFSADVKTFVDMWQAIKYTATFNNSSPGDAYIKAHLYMDNTLMDFQPEFLVANGGISSLTQTDTFTINAFRQLETTGRHTWEIYLEVIDESNKLDSITIAIGDSNGILRGQGLNDESTWDGIISIVDSVRKIPAIGGQMKTIVESGINVTTKNPTKIELSLNVPRTFTMPMQMKSLSEFIEINTGYKDEWLYCGENGYCDNYDTLL